MFRKLIFFFEILRQRGIKFLWIYFIESYWFDLRNGTRTSFRVPQSDQVINESKREKSDGLLYVASFTSVIRHSLSVAEKKLGRKAFAGAQFFDLGCGKGKSLLLYNKEFRDVSSPTAIGLEYDGNLSSIAISNLSKCGIPRNNVSVATTSATNLNRFVQAEVLIIYLYNSFQGQTLRDVLQLLSSKPHVLIYVDPSERGILSHYGYKIVEDIKGKFNADTWLVATSKLLNLG